MILNFGSLAFNCDLSTGGGTPAWGTELGQGEGYKFSFEDTGEFLSAMLYCAVPDTNEVICPLGKGGNQALDYEFVIASIFNKVFVNGMHVPNGQFLLLIVKKINGLHHVGRRTIKYSPNIKYRLEYINQTCFNLIGKTLGITDDAAWFVHEITTKNQDELHFSASVLNPAGKMSFESNEARKHAFLAALNIPQFSETTNNYHQQIFFGSPGTGKSFKVNEQIMESHTPEDCIFRTTFHPDSDYASFVGSYKPTKKGDELTYEFIPQTFTDAYVKAWQSPEEKVFLVIEEINRGNCAQIFGDLFQLLDRGKDGKSEYPIKADADLRKYLESDKGLGAGHDGIKDGKLSLPSNLNILATMNTSDQSLFPMDSAFKRRWTWEYVPVNADCPDSQFKITIGENENEKTYKWSSFLKIANERIHKLSDSEDKQMGNFFIKSDINADEFRSKVMFYLWSEVCKEYESCGSFFKYRKQDGSEAEFTFNSLFPDGNETDTILQGFMAYLGVEPDK